MFRTVVIRNAALLRRGQTSRPVSMVLCPEHVVFHPNNSQTASVISNNGVSPVDLSRTISGLSAGVVSTLWQNIQSGILFLKRTFQPSLLRRKRKHGFLARAATKDGLKILKNRRAKGRRSLCA